MNEELNRFLASLLAVAIVMTPAYIWCLYAYSWRSKLKKLEAHFRDVHYKDAIKWACNGDDSPEPIVERKWVERRLDDLLKQVYEKK